MNILLGVLNVLVISITSYFFQKSIQWFSYHRWFFFDYSKLPFIISIPLQFVLIDFFMYWWHRLNHIAPWLWYFHKLHHTDTQLNITSTFRFHTGELLLSYIFKLFFFLLLGIQLFPILVYGIIFLPVVMFHHSNIKVSDNIQRILGYVIVVPNIHRIHHSKIIKETNSNFSSIFSFWDKIFITFTDKPKNKTINFGL